ncbi:uncharacterized protein LOC124888961 [Capsicum annuum]|uniref:uncharacterized protein LOC124888961 n=1 Tax=Capsicum annuum TaxID=4072 RepID=UPI001FB0E05B|nr:uncharacterized protein LOC124888961 [Capsicum annuum]
MGSKGHCILPLLQQKQYLKIGPTEKEKRGRTQMQTIYGRTERRLIVLNEHNQPIVPTLGVVQELSSFLGTLARNSTFCPLTVKTWKKVNTKKDMWNYIKEKYDIPNAGQKWALGTIQDAWRMFNYSNDKV